ncbi:hypothetical protein RJ639_047389 [Escallonia herrerae]|uniref:Leucine-rich repeat-containing N-terminal plant-type domain-containing protein n=1 Tax=Escallonia herrerae TaxID=1293975 RepID=A0AA89AZW4_9ASTE|nr:hypothetical protein RJ639_047389 [Escallonia herrerae]
MEGLCTILLISLVGLALTQGNAVLDDGDKQALLDFVNSFPHSRDLDWDVNSAVCNNWTGVTCSQDESRVLSLRLPGVGFHGRIPANTLSRLTALQILSLRSNGITGPFPSDLYDLKNLTYLYLQFNKFSGPLPANFSVWKNLTIVNLSNNGFNGSIPKGISNLTLLSTLNLANNSLSGVIPDLHLPNLQQLNLSNNNLTGILPKSLQSFPKSVFSGNSISLPYSPIPGPPGVLSFHQPNSKPKNAGRLSESALLGIIIAGCVLGVIGLAFLLLVWCLRRRDNLRYASNVQFDHGEVEISVWIEKYCLGTEMQSDIGMHILAFLLHLIRRRVSDQTA